MILCATFALASIPMVAWAEDFENNMEKSFTVSPGGKLKVEVDLGSVTVNTDADGKTEIHVYRKFKKGSQSDADKWFANHPVAVSQQGDEISITQKNKKPFVWTRGIDVEVRYVVSIPRKFNVDLSTAGGSITVADLDGTASCRTSSGQIKLAKIAGKVSASDAGGSISLESGGSDVFARTSSGSVQIQKAAGKVEASTAGGSIKIDECASSVSVSTSSGSITIDSAKGDVTAKNAGGSIKLGSVNGSVSAESSSGSISIGSVDGKNVEVRNAGGSVDIGTAAGDVTARTSSGLIRVKKAGGTVSASNAGGQIAIDESAGDIIAQTSSGSILIGNAKGKLDLKDAGGRIEIKQANGTVNAETSSGDIVINFANTPKEDCRIHTSGGGIKLGVLHAASLNVDAKSAGGSVKVEPPLTVAVQGANKHGELQGKINGGGPNFNLRSSSGNIHLREWTPEKLAAEADDGKSGK